MPWQGSGAGGTRRFEAKRHCQSVVKVPRRTETGVCIRPGKARRESIPAVFARRDTLHPRSERVTKHMALRTDRHRTRPIAALARHAGTTIDPRWATIHVGQERDVIFEILFETLWGINPIRSRPAASRNRVMRGLTAEFRRRYGDGRAPCRAGASTPSVHDRIHDRDHYGTTSLMTPSCLFIRNTRPSGPVPKRRSTRTAGSRPCSRVFSATTCRSVRTSSPSRRSTRRIAS